MRLKCRIHSYRGRRRLGETPCASEDDVLLRLSLIELSSSDRTIVPIIVAKSRNLTGISSVLEGVIVSV